jgi:hypothetical protein
MFLAILFDKILNKIYLCTDNYFVYKRKVITIDFNKIVKQIPFLKILLREKIFKEAGKLIYKLNR